MDESLLTVLGPRPSIDPGQLDQRRLEGDAAGVEVRLDEAGARPGGRVRGTVVVTARRPVIPADVVVFLFRSRLSHRSSTARARERMPGERGSDY